MLNHIAERFQEFGYKSYELIPGVVMVENFISEDNADNLISFAEKSEQSEWEVEYYQNFINFCNEKFGRTDVDNFIFFLIFRCNKIIL